MARRPSVDEDGLTELGRRWRDIAIAGNDLIAGYMFDVARYRIELGKDLEFGTLPTKFRHGGEKEKNAPAE